MRGTVVFFNRQGRAVKLEGLGAYTPKIDLDGAIGVGAGQIWRSRIASTPLASSGGTSRTGRTSARPAMSWRRCGTRSTRTIRWPRRWCAPFVRVHCRARGRRSGSLIGTGRVPGSISATFLAAAAPARCGSPSSKRLKSRDGQRWRCLTPARSSSWLGPIPTIRMQSCWFPQGR